MNLKLQVTVGPYHRFVVSVFVSPTFLVGRPGASFCEARCRYAPEVRQNYDISPDGKRFLP